MSREIKSYFSELETTWIQYLEEISEEDDEELQEMKSLSNALSDEENLALYQVEIKRLHKQLHEGADLNQIFQEIEKVQKLITK